MSRKAPIISLDELKKLCREKLAIGTEDFDPYENFTSKINDDLKKVNFDFENWNIGNADPSFERYPSDHSGFCNYPVGYETLPNGLPVLFVNAGGDWECPICFCIYWDGKTLRAYIPDEGNFWNRKEKCAYGSEAEPTEEDDEIAENGKEADPDLIRQDVMNRIEIK